MKFWFRSKFFQNRQNGTFWHILENCQFFDMYARTFKLAITHPLFDQSGFMVAQKTIIYRLVMRNLSYEAYFSVLIFWATFGGKMGVATTRAPNGLGPLKTTKKLAQRVSLLGHEPIFRNHVFEIFRGEPPLNEKQKIIFYLTIIRSLCEHCSIFDIVASNEHKSTF